MPYALVTGALGGIGQAICRVLAAKGYGVVAMDKEDGTCECRHFIHCDIRDFHRSTDRCADLVREVRSITGGSLDLLVNNAAHQVVRPAGELSNEDWEATISTNLTAPFMMIREFLPDLEKCGGSVVNVASIHANLTKPGFAAYATSKGGLVSMTRALAVDLGPRGVRVNALLPAAISTPMLRAGFDGNPEGLDALSAMHPVGRIGECEEVAEFIAFLASPLARFINGAALQIDGGIGARLHDPV